MKSWCILPTSMQIRDVESFLNRSAMDVTDRACRRREHPTRREGKWPVRIFLYLLVASYLMLASAAHAQELTPRAYWPLPKDTNVLVLSYQRSSGDIITDPSLPVTGVDSDIDALQVSYQRSLGLFGRSANLQLSLPYSNADTEGFAEGMFRNREMSGAADARARISINLKGAPSMDRAGLQTLFRNPETIVGASVLLQLPTGEYDADKLINLGTNRWSIKPAIGVIWPIHPTWLLEVEVGSWIFGDNNEFLGTTREQNPVLSAEVHLVKHVRQGMWVSLDANYYVGGRTIVGGESRGDSQRNSRAGATMLFPFKGGHAIRGSFSTGVAIQSGGDYDMFSLSYLYAW